MAAKKNRQFIYWFILILLIVIVAETAGYFAMRWNSRGGDFLSNRTYFHIRDMLRGETAPQKFPKYLSQPYLGYIPYPGYSKIGTQEHNKDGYRGKLIPLVKTGKFRIICMGGSTTYGMSVPLFEQSYPAQLDSLLNNYFASNARFTEKYTGVEVLNAGVEAGASTEELTQYILKYRYYKPDLVILHTGGNDALISPEDANFQPDYTHYRRNNFNLLPLPVQSRWLLNSYFISYITIRLFYSDFANPFYYFEQDGTAKYCHWNTLNIDSMIKKGDYRFCPFYQNLNSLAREIKADSARILYLPFLLNPADKMVKENEEYRNSVALYNTMMKEAAENKGDIYLNITNDSVRFDLYGTDDCHLTAGGEKLKAEIVSRAVIALIEQVLLK